jgi:APA family basic amino acid/polyamine antiporter
MSIQPRLGTFDLAMLTVSFIIGMGIFRTPVLVAQAAQTPAVFFGAWLLGGLVSACGALTYAEIGSRFPVTGGFYQLFSRCYHPAFAFMVNWLIVFSNAASVASVAIVGAEYLNPILLPADWQAAAGIRLTTLLTIGLLFLVNLLGIKTSARTQNVLTVLKLGGMALLVLAAFAAPERPATPSPDAPTGTPASLLLAAFVPVFFTYGGYQQTINFGGDAQNATRSIPRGIFLGVALVLALYLTINVAYVRTLGFAGVQGSTALAADTAAVFFGETGYRFVSVLLFISVLGFVNSAMLSNPRVYYAMAEDGVLPPAFQRVDARTQVQVVALTLFTAYLVAAVWFIGTFEKLLSFVMVFDSVGMVASAAAIFVLRKHPLPPEGGTTGTNLVGLNPLQGAGGEPYRITRGRNLVPVVFILTYTAVAVQAFRNAPETGLVGLSLFGLGLPLYWGMRRMSK